MLTRRCAERRYFLRPSPEANNAYIYCLAVAAERYSIDVCWVSNMSNHAHPGIHDPLGNYPKFMQYFHSLVGRCLNVHLGRWENFWAAEQAGVLHLADADAIFDKMIYALANPVKDHLVDRVSSWPGVNSLEHHLKDEPLMAKRPWWFFDRDGDMPEEVVLELKRPPGFEHLSQEQWADKIRAAVSEVEQKAAAERARTGARVLGRQAVRRQSPFECPKTCPPRRRLRPRVATRNKALRIGILRRNKLFQHRYRAAYRQRTAGDATAVFPYGTYLLAERKLVHVEQPPARE